MNSQHFLVVAIFLVFSFVVDAQECTILKNNSFTYKLAKKEVLVEFTDNEYIEYHQGKKYYIKSTIEWISDCEYYLEIQETTLPNLPFQKGSKLHTVITKVKKNKVYYTSSIAGKTWKGKMTKKKD
tara:strand:- start:2190 stop:2567 length:378 start_codon:yes stop_codon:yes gene_type:complete